MSFEKALMIGMTIFIVLLGLAVLVLGLVFNSVLVSVVAAVIIGLQFWNYKASSKRIV